MRDVIIVGNLGQDAEIKYFESGKVKTTFFIAVEKYNKEKKEKETDWFRIECWEKLAEFAGEHLKKGTTVIVEGTVKRETYKDKETDEEKTIYKVIADKIRFNGAYTLCSDLQMTDKRPVAKF